MPLGANKAAIMGVAGVSTGDVVLLSSQTASNSASISFTSGITSTYGEYIFKFYDVNPATDAVEFQFQGSIDAGSNYNVTMTTTVFRTHHREDDGESGLGYETGMDQAQGTSFQNLSSDTGNDADSSIVGTLQLFNPSSTTYVKHFDATMQTHEYQSQSREDFIAGYFNTTDNIDAIQFKMSSGNFDGTIKMWGVK